MDYFEAVKSRRSIRKFSPKKVPDEIIRKALEAALLAPNSSNMQPWEFYWVRSSDKKKQLVDACLSQAAARTASDLIVAVSRIDTWKRNRKIMLEKITELNSPSIVRNYYERLIPFMYGTDRFGIWALIKNIALCITSFFRPVMNVPRTRGDLFEVMTKSTALACENLMLGIVAQGYACCPMEGFDERRVKKILNLNSSSHIVMVIGIGEGTPQGIYGPQIRFDPKLFIFEI